MIARDIRSSGPFGSWSNQPELFRIGMLLKECSVRHVSKDSQGVENAGLAAQVPPMDTSTSKDEESRNLAAHRVYERYGADLAAFKRDVEREVTAQNEEAQEK